MWDSDWLVSEGALELPFRSIRPDTKNLRHIVRAVVVVGVLVMVYDP